MTKKLIKVLKGQTFARGVIALFSFIINNGFINLAWKLLLLVDVAIKGLY